MHDIIGIDISKTTLNIHRLSDGKQARFDNDEAGLAALRRVIGEAPVRVVHVATGRHHRHIERAMDAAGHVLVEMTPARARRLAQAIGQEVGTDRVDAAVLARLGETLDLDAEAARTEAMQEARELHGARIGLVEDRTACLDRLEGLRDKLVGKQIEARLKLIDEQVAELEAELRRVVAEDRDLARRFQILTSIPGIDFASAVAMIVELPELGDVDAKQVAALAGLAPVARPSGEWRGKSGIGGGQRGLRDALHESALSAIEHNPQLREVYGKLREAGKPEKVAITAVTRKLVVLANALIGKDREWTPTGPRADHP